MYMQNGEKTADHQEFDEMYRKNSAEIYKFIRYRVKDKELAKDVLQETFIVAYKKWDTVRELPNPTAWLIGVARNKIREFSRALKKIECEVALETDEHMAVEDGYDKAELDIVILKNLTEAEKRRFIWYCVCGYSISDMAKFEKISENNMSVRISRLRDKIAKNLSVNLSDGTVFDKKRKEFVRIDKKTSCTIKRDSGVEA